MNIFSKKIPDGILARHGAILAARIPGTLLLGALLLGALLLGGCTAETPAAPADPPPPAVTVVQPIAQDILEWDEYTGRLEAIDFVEVRARVSGYLESIHFEDGEMVNKGDLLFVIDPRPFEAELEQQKADLLRAEAALELAASNYRRAEQLLDEKVIPQEAYDTRSSVHREAEVAIQAARARVEKARLDVEYTQVRAPIRGRISANYISVGNYVSGGSAQATLLTTLVSLDPIYCSFEVSERDYLEYARLAQAGADNSGQSIRLQLADEEGFPHAGRMQFVDNRLDPGTATMRVRAEFDNPDGLLTPGLFARLRLAGGQEYPAFLIPDRAINTDQSQKYVLTVDAENMVVYQPVELGPLVDGLRVVRQGIGAADRVIVNGVMRARPGAPVTPTLETLTLEPLTLEPPETLSPAGAEASASSNETPASEVS